MVLTIVPTIFDILMEEGEAQNAVDLVARPSRTYSLILEVRNIAGLSTRYAFSFIQYTDSNITNMAYILLLIYFLIRHWTTWPLECMSLPT